LVVQLDPRLFGQVCAVRVSRDRPSNAPAASARRASRIGSGAPRPLPRIARELAEGRFERAVRTARGSASRASRTPVGTRRRGSRAGLRGPRAALVSRARLRGHRVFRGAIVPGAKPRARACSGLGSGAYSAPFAASSPRAVALQGLASRHEDAASAAGAREENPRASSGYRDRAVAALPSSVEGRN
jgi:hypothetical protein